MYYRDAVAILLTFSLTDEVSFANLEKWLQDIEENAMMANVLTVLIGTKADLVQERAVSIETATKFANEHNWLFIETSAK